ncbi:MAG: hypothetical protein NTW95_00540 [Candidatus Aminicenantes bacterium]|nr:hypothetical protein [Candidatus Aminicenantes bacterium]
MSQHILKKPTLDLGALEIDIQHRLQRGKTRMLITHILLFIAVASTFLIATAGKY